MAQRSSSMSAILKAGSKATISSPILKVHLYLMFDAPGPEFVIKPSNGNFRRRRPYLGAARGLKFSEWGISHRRDHEGGPPWQCRKKLSAISQQRAR